MTFDIEGRSTATPADIQRLFDGDSRRLINGVLLSCVPKVFDTRSAYCNFIEAVSDQLRIHPRNLVFRGSTLLGFSFKPEKLWMSVSPVSDIDLAIVDSDYYHVVDREVRHLETLDIATCGVRGETWEKRKKRRENRKFYSYRFFDLPNLPVVSSQKEALKRIPEALFDRPRPISAFIYRDWWSLFDRWETDIRSLRSGIRALPPAPPSPLPFENGA